MQKEYRSSNKEEKTIMFTQENYMKMKLLRMMGMETIPDEIVQQVKNELEENKVPASLQNIKVSLKKLNLARYYDNASFICQKLNPKLEQITLEETTECSVCFEELKEMIQLRCKHMFCIVCIDKIKDHGVIKCPLCRSPQTVFTSINYKDKEIILDEFIKTRNQYYNEGFSGRKTMMPFDQIIRIIAEKNGIKL